MVLRKMKTYFALTAVAFVFSLIIPFAKADAFEGEMLDFSKDSGYYSSQFNLTISSDAEYDIYYTLDGSVPVVGGDSTKKYTGPITISSMKGKTPVLTTRENASKFVDSGSANVQSASSLERATIVRAIGVDSGGFPTPVSTKTYFIGSNIKDMYNGCAVMSIVTDPANLLDGDTGIYVLGNAYNEHSSGWGGDDDVLEQYANFMQHGKTWERSSFMELFDGENTPLVQTGVGIRIHGGYSRRNQQKSLNIYFRSDYDYGSKTITGYDMIPGTATTTFKSFMLRNGGNDSDICKFQDVFIQSMVTDKHFDTQMSRPCVLYLNGEFWGLYNLTEKYSDRYLQEKYGVSSKNVLVYKDMELDEGTDTDSAELNALLALGDLDMTKEENYQKFKDMVDIDSFIDYYATELYINNNDWWSGCNPDTPNNNIEFWKFTGTPAEGSTNPYEDGRWRYMLFDTEWSMGLYGSTQAGYNYDSIKYHAIGEPDPNFDNDRGRTTANGSPLFRALIKNDDFKKRLTNALLDITYWNFDYDRSCDALDAFSDVFTPLMNKHRDRWNSGNVSNGVNNMKNFIKNRVNYIPTMLENNISNIKKSDRVNTFFMSNVAKNLKVNTINPTVSADWYDAIYYKPYPVEVTAPDIDGYKFDRWDVEGGKADNANNNSTSITFTDSDAKVKAIYKTDAGVEPTMAPTPTPKPTPTPAPTRDPNSGWGWGDDPWNWGWGDNPWGWNNPTATPAPTAAPTAAPATDKPVSTKEPGATAKPGENGGKDTKSTYASDGKSAVTPSQDGSKNTVTDNPGDDSAGTVFTAGAYKYVIKSESVAAIKGPVAKGMNKAVIPSSITYKGKKYKVTDILTGAFKGSTSLTAVTIGSNIETIGRKAFYGCKKLKKIVFKTKTLKKMYKNSFKSVSKKAKASIPSTKKKTYKKLFKKCGILTFLKK